MPAAAAPFLSAAKTRPLPCPGHVPPEVHTNTWCLYCPMSLNLVVAAREADAALELRFVHFSLRIASPSGDIFCCTHMAEPWLRGPIAGMPALAMPSAHALMQAAEDIPVAVQGLTVAQLWALPGGAAAVGFH